MCRSGVSLADRTIAVVGATGAIGHALSLLCAERAAELILIGNLQVADASVGRLRIVAQDRERHVRALAVTGRKFRPTLRSGCCGAPLRRRMPTSGITVTTDIDQHLPRAHAVLTATNAVLPFISARHLRNGALVCDISRPFNVAPDLGEERRDVRMVDGGLVQAPEGSVLELPRSPTAATCCSPAPRRRSSSRCRDFAASTSVDGLTPRPSRTWARSPQALALDRALT